jgi:radical SAM superfamily enzyme YgiQ (UPF0313 family)
MARVFLVQPPSSEVMRRPGLALGFLAAALRRAGHAVAVADAAAPRGPHETGEIAQQIALFDPQLVGVHVKTLGLHRAYQLVADLQAHPETPRGVAWVAGGPHATVRPLEPLDHGFDLTVVGEGEAALVEIADAVDRGALPASTDLSHVHGLAWRDQGLPVQTPRRGPVEDLDALASPTDALDLFDPAWYGLNSPASFGGVLASRGCPAACTFCCNAVTGRTFRAHSPERIAHEAMRLRDEQHSPAFAFFDDSFAVNRRRVAQVAAALERLGGVHWSASVHPTHLDTATLDAMRRGGCGGLDLGAESGDALRIKQIGKGVTVDRVLHAVKLCRDAGVRVMVNAMFGWPDETAAELDATCTFLEQAAASGAMLNARGVLVPYPGTALYDAQHQRHGFTDWWLDREKPFEYEPFPESADPQSLRRAYATDAALARNFFGHPDDHLRRIQQALDLKASLTWPT